MQGDFDGTSETRRPLGHSTSRTREEQSVNVVLCGSVFVTVALCCQFLKCLTQQAQQGENNLSTPDCLVKFHTSRTARTQELRRFFLTPFAESPLEMHHSNPTFRTGGTWFLENHPRYTSRCPCVQRLASPWRQTRQRLSWNTLRFHIQLPFLNR